ncbi:MAG: hypothetical protein ACP5XB_07585 [Isosphaeraceae bacterium]
MITTSTTREHPTAADDPRQRAGPGVEEYRDWSDATAVQAAEERLGIGSHSGPYDCPLATNHSPELPHAC